MKHFKLSLIFFMILLTFIFFSCSSDEKKRDVKPRTELGKLVYHQLPNFYIENFTENQIFAQSFYVNQQKHLFLAIRAQKNYYNFHKKLNDEYFETNCIKLADHLVYEGINQTDINISYMLVFEKNGLICEVYFRTSQGHTCPLQQIKQLATEIATKILKS